ncbi:phage holin family protein [Brevibacillus fulvus]|uniref:Membrane protein n=1 Tax=Brevibacillus fulvus TaxID=1125967 RepID=A0A938Y156_9BACL|nr:phage holin family protein [Brevibacillus fulvus]MBM7591446.1 putative membrane protein [Brevibacillus fulvus]
MVRWLIRLLLNGIALLFISYVFENIRIESYGVAIVAAFLLGLVNTLVRPIIRLLTLPLRMMTLGLFSFVINAITFALTAALVDGFELGDWPQSIVTTILAAIFMSLLSRMIDFIVGRKQ